MARYSDIQLIQILQKAARRINARLKLFGSSDEVTVDASGNLSPDDGTLTDLVLMQAECMLVSRDFNSDLNNGSLGISITDGEQAINTVQAGTARGVFFNSPFSPCAELDKRIKETLFERSAGYGKLIW
jgi:hypothetical protein